MLSLTKDGCVVVGVGELGVSRGPGSQVATHALGSCVAVFAWHPITKVGACLHYLLPENPGHGDPLKYGDTGIPVLLRAVAPSSRDLALVRIVATGGAKVQPGVSRFEIGPRNATAVRAVLAARGLELAAYDLGGRCARSARLDVRTGRVEVVCASRTRIL